MFRILTEAINVQEVLQELIRLGLDYTAKMAEGAYMGVQEKSLEIEFENARKELVLEAARQIKLMNKQEAVLVQEIPTISEMV